jgi:pimeloyl-ACP methyl ester carboxylesterase
MAMHTGRQAWILLVTSWWMGHQPARSQDTPAPVRAEPHIPPEGMRFKRVHIISEGVRLTGELFRPKDRPEGEKLPTIILCHGWGGTAAGLRPEAVAFARAGFMAVSFDYRGWGASDGRVILAKPKPGADGKGHVFRAEVREIREVVDPIEQTNDLQNVVHWTAGEPGVDPARIRLWGSSYSGGHVVYVAARDPRIKCLVAQVPALDSRWVGWGLQRGVTLREATRMARGEIGYPEPGAVVIGGLHGAPIRAKLLDYAPVEDAARASQCAMLFLVAEKEELFRNEDNGRLAFERARGPKKYVVLPGITHYGVYREARAEATRLEIEWFKQHLKAQPAAPAAGEKP